MVRYYLMNKDTIVLSFVIARTNNYTNVIIDKQFNEQSIPFEIRNGVPINSWIDNRIVISHRTDILKHFKSIGITNLEDIINITKCISLNDTFWVKEEKSKLMWKSVSPYTNPLNSEIARYSFDDKGTINGKLISHSPDFATSGNYPKCWKRANGKIYLYKAGTSLYSNSGQEPYCEYLASIVASRLTNNYIRYELVTYRKKVATRCECMCTEDIGLYGLGRCLPDIDSYEKLLNSPIFIKDRQKIIDMLLLDYVTLNTDRHFNNIGVLVNNNNQSLIGISPIYDNNMALLPYYYVRSSNISSDIEEYIRENREHIVSADGRTFDELFRLIKCKYVINKLKQLARFKLNSCINRADIANVILERQIRKGLKGE